MYRTNAFKNDDKSIEDFIRRALRTNFNRWERIDIQPIGSFFHHKVFTLSKTEEDSKVNILSFVFRKYYTRPGYKIIMLLGERKNLTIFIEIREVKIDLKFQRNYINR